MKTKHNIIQHQSGFTLVELLIAMMVALIVSAAIYASYKVQQQTHKAQTQVTEIQQNLRAALGTISREFVFVGFDPTYSGEYGITAAIANNFQFTADYCENGEAPSTTGCPPDSGPYGNEDDNGNNILDPGEDQNGDGMLELGNYEEVYNFILAMPASADPNDTTALQQNGRVIAENIESIEFLYILEDGTETLAPGAALPDIRSVRVTLIGRADDPDFKYTDNKTYPLGSSSVPTINTPALGPYNDNFRRRSLIKTIELRNMGII